MTTLKEVIAEPFTCFYRSFAGTKPTVPAVNRTATQIRFGRLDAGRRPGRQSVSSGTVSGWPRPHRSRRSWGRTASRSTTGGSPGDEAMVEFSLVDASIDILALALHQSAPSKTGTGTTAYKEVGFGHSAPAPAAFVAVSRAVAG